MRMRTLTYTIVTAVILIAAAFYGYQYFANRDDNQPIGTPTSLNGPKDDVRTTYPLQVFFSKSPQSNDDPNKVFGLQRNSMNPDVATFAVKELLKGPTAEEKAAGYFSKTAVRAGPSNCDDNDFRLTIADGVATLRFCRVFDHLGVVADGQAESQLNTTLKQFDSVKRVVILNRTGDCEFDLSGQNSCKSGQNAPAPSGY